MNSKTDNIIMSNTFSSIFTLLNRLDLALDSDSVDVDEVSPKALKISKNRWKHYIKMLSAAGYITGVTIRTFNDGEEDYDVSDIMITLKGIQYLCENSIMNKFAQFAKSIGQTVAEAGVNAAADVISRKI